MSTEQKLMKVIKKLKMYEGKDKAILADIVNILIDIQEDINKVYELTEVLEG